MLSLLGCVIMWRDIEACIMFTVILWLGNHRSPLHISHRICLPRHEQVNKYCRNPKAKHHSWFVILAAESPFDSPLLSSRGFLALLCPMLRILKLCDLCTSINTAQFAAVCEITSLEELHIEGCFSEDPVPEYRPIYP
jgi:hypothetical protein